jgi:hypothetical protein
LGPEGWGGESLRPRPFSDSGIFENRVEGYLYVAITLVASTEQFESSILSSLAFSVGLWESGARNECAIALKGDTEIPYCFPFIIPRLDLEWSLNVMQPDCRGSARRFYSELLV